MLRSQFYWFNLGIFKKPKSHPWVFWVLPALLNNATVTDDDKMYC
jgi:hypothetical protein